MTQRRNYTASSAFDEESSSRRGAERRQPRKHSLYFVVAVAASGGMLFGYGTAVISGAMLFLQKSFALTPASEEIAVSAVLLGAIVGSLIGGKMSDALGRRMTLIIMALIFTTGALLTSFSPDLAFFIVSRILVGFSIGAVACVVPVYISEMAPARVRGTLVTLNQLAITIGIALSYWIDLAFANAHLGWAPMFAVAAIPGAILLTGMTFNTETPRWLASKGRWKEARLVLERLTDIQTEQELSAIRVSLASQHNAGVRELLRPGLRMALVVGAGLAIFQQLIGINTVIYYAPTIFGYAGFASASSAILATGVVGAVNVLATVLASLLIDRVGRRPLLLWGTAGMVVTLAALGTIFALGPRQGGYLTLAALLIYIISFALSMGPVVWLMGAEIFPTRLRATGSSISTFANWSANLLVSVTFLSLINLVGKPCTFWLYALLGLGAFVFCWLLVPETRNKSLEQIERYWQDGRQWERPVSLPTPQSSANQVSDAPTEVHLSAVTTFPGAQNRPNGDNEPERIGSTRK